MLHTYFFESAAEHPEAIALEIDCQRLSYALLLQQVETILEEIRGVTNDTTGLSIAVFCEKTPLAYAAMLAIMASGNIFVPLNPRLQSQRNAIIATKARVHAILADEASAQLLPSMLALLPQPPRVLVPGTQQIRRLRQTPISPYSDPSAYAYLIFTSGSTGAPKGVPIRHRSICRCIDDLRGVLGTGAQDRFIQLAALTFDFSIGEIFLAWKSGGCLCVPSSSQTLLAHEFARRHAITVWSSVPSVIANLFAAQALPPGSLPTLRVSYFCGEVLTESVAESWSRAASSSRIYNLYGPTEAAVFATWFRFDASTASDEVVLPIGRPFGGLHCLVVDKDHRAITQPDIVGELLLGGTQVFDGYWDEPSATDRAFVWISGEGHSTQRWYRTGDLAAWSRDGKLRFRGRTDRQVKLRGLRVELQEIEMALRFAADCPFAAVLAVARADRRIEDLAGIHCGDVSEAEIRHRCADRLPLAMVPKWILRLDRIPANDNGKTDYQALASLLPNLIANFKR